MYLAKGLKNDHTLQYLNLDCNYITTKGFDCLIDGFYNDKRHKACDMIKLNVCYNHIDDITCLTKVLGRPSYR
eukprot:UN03823